MLANEINLFPRPRNTETRFNFFLSLQISEDTPVLLAGQPGPSWMKRGQVEVKGKGKMTTYIIDARG